MIKWLLKYGFVIYLLNTIILSIEKTFVLGYNIFLSLMFCFSFAFLINLDKVKLVLFQKSFRFLLILSLLNIIYWFIFHQVNDIDSLKYLLARIMQFTIIPFAIFYNYNYFKFKFFDHLVYVLFLVVFIGLILDPYIFDMRYSGLVWNPNILSSISCIGFATLLLSYKKLTKINQFMLLVFIVTAISSGSRSALLAIALAFLFKYGFSYRNIIYAFISIIIYFIVLNFDVSTSINRFNAQSLFNDRVLQYKYAYETFLQKPFFGFGLDKYAYINQDIVPSNLSSYIISAHNAYLAIIVQYGIIFGLIFLGIIFYKILKIFKNINLKEPVESYYFYIITYVVIASLYETLITGINEIHTILFWFSLSFLSYLIYNRVHEN